MDINRILKHDFVATLITAVLLIIGTLVIYGATFNTTDSNILTKQLILITLGLFLYFLIITIDIAWFKVFSLQMIMYIFIIGTLVYVNLFGSNIAETNRWIDFGFFAFQPSEYAKVLILLFVSLIFSGEILPNKEDLDRIETSKEKTLTFRKRLILNIKKYLRSADIKALFFVFLYVSPIIFLTFIQPALGNTIIITLLTALTVFFSLKKTSPIIIVLLYSLLFAIWVLGFIHFDFINSEFTISFNAVKTIPVIVIPIMIVTIAYFLKTKIWQVFLILGLVVMATLSFFLAWNNISEYQRERVVTFVSGPERDPLGSGFQIIQSKIAIGSGQLLGRGYLQGTQSSLHILTQAHTDFAFASMSEQFGFVGAVLLLTIYIFLILRILKISKEIKSGFGKNFCFGAVSLLLIHIFINVGMNIGKLPVTGIPLPLVSYGGSSVLMTLIVLGIVQSIYASRRPVDMADSLMITSLRGKEID